MLISAFGSAGDVLPLLSVANSLEEQGCEVRLAMPAPLALLLRHLRERRAYSLGGDVSALHDGDLVSGRFDGWTSWLRASRDYVTPTFDAALERTRRLASEWMPDVVVCTPLAAAARTAAHLLGCRHVTLAAHPMLGHVGTASRFGVALQRRISSVVAVPLGRRATVELAWGSGPGFFTMHDNALLRPVGLASTSVLGYPFKEPPPDEALAAALDWLNSSDKPAVLVTFGSLLGRSQQAVLEELARQCTRAGARVLVGGSMPSPVFASKTRFALTNTVVFASSIIERVAAVVSHGGTGSILGAVRKAKPIGIFPMGFDQLSNAEAVRIAGCGLDLRRDDHGGIPELIDAGGSQRVHAMRIAGEITAPSLATHRICDLIVRAG